MNHSNLPYDQGTYFILNKQNDRIYVGASGNVRTRANMHYAALARGNHHNAALQSDWMTYGAGAFEFGLLVENMYSLCVRDFEAFFVRLYQSDNPRYGYNIGFFDGRQPPSKTYAEQIKAIARAWQISNRRYSDEVIRRCIAHT